MVSPPPSDIENRTVVCSVNNDHWTSAPRLQDGFPELGASFRDSAIPARYSDGFLLDVVFTLRPAQEIGPRDLSLNCPVIAKSFYNGRIQIILLLRSLAER